MQKTKQKLHNIANKECNLDRTNNSLITNGEETSFNTNKSTAISTPASNSNKSV